MSSLELQRPRAKNLTLELKIISATDVSHAHIDDTDNMDVYAVVSINSDYMQTKQAAKTPIDYDGGSNPTWNHTVKFSVIEKAALDGLSTVKVKLLSFWLEGEDDLYLGEVNVSVQELLALNPLKPSTNGSGNKMKSMTCPIRVIRASTKARLSLSYRFKPIPVNDLYPSAPDYLSSKPASPGDDKYPSAPDYSLLSNQPVYQNTDPPRSAQPVMYAPQIQTSMGKLTLQILIKFAKGIKDVNTFSAMDVYATVLILEDKKIKQGINTPIAYSAYTNPTWNHQAMEFPIDAQLAQEGRLSLLVKLISVRPSLGDKEIGRVKVPLEELLGLNSPSPLTNDDSNVMKLVAHDVTGPYGTKGKLSFSYRFLAPEATLFSPSAQPPTTSKPFATHMPVTHQSNESYGTVHSTPSYHHLPVTPRAKVGPSNGQLPFSMPPPYQSHEYQQYSQTQQQYQLPQSQAQPQTQSERPVVKPQGRNMAELGIGTAVLGRAIGGALMSDMTMSDEVNIFDSIYSESMI
ncbi:hypothetical protein EUTSA_v10026840mg [Eutrema salsugineum]|uniref:C2 domain-containing protein n=1 Tax=Eutrema salsugineum TaxID=72664 RepID=V4MKB6_EUTSA|nr:uncharacterized protein LOC18028440 [Eutrema salsugineum]ESQ55912.1 hypothetical protein EUTSA_v10026840mg [Eutrema salsugineum]